MKDMRWAEIDSCPECGSKKIVRDKYTTEVLCKECGLILSDHAFDDLSEIYSIDDSINNTNRNIIDNLRRDDTLQTYVGNILDMNNEKKNYKLKKTNTRERYYEQSQYLTDGIVEIKRICSLLLLPKSIKVSSISLFKLLDNENFFHGRQFDNVLAAIIYYSCRQFRIPRLISEIIKTTDANKKKVRRTYLKIAKKTNNIQKPFTAEDYLTRYVNEFNMTNELTMAKKILNDTSLDGSGKNPRGVVGGIVRYISKNNGNHITQKEISSKLNISTDVIRQRVKDIEKHIDV